MERKKKDQEEKKQDKMPGETAFTSYLPEPEWVAFTAGRIMVCDVDRIGSDG